MTRLRASSGVRTLGDATPVTHNAVGAHIAGKTGKEMRAEAQARADAQPMRSQCGYCAWSVESTASVARAAFVAHLAQSHEDVVRGLPKRVRNRSFAEQAAAARERKAK
jgi:hypothetical protein